MKIKNLHYIFKNDTKVLLDFLQKIVVFQGKALKRCPLAAKHHPTGVFKR